MRMIGHAARFSRTSNDTRKCWSNFQIFAAFPSPADGPRGNEADAGRARGLLVNHSYQPFEAIHMRETPKQGEPNRDPISGAPGAHPVGTGLGAAAGGMAAGAAAGTVAGPVGTVIGAAIGAVAGGLAGKGVAEMIDPTVEEAYWRETYVSRP